MVWNTYLPSGISSRNQGFWEKIVIQKIEEKNPEIDQFNFLIYSLALSENCPYSPEQLWAMNIPQLWKVKDLVHIQDAFRAAIDKDNRPKDKKNG